MGGEIQNVDRSAAESLIGWWLESGVDSPVGEVPRDWLRRNDPAPAPQPAAQLAEKPADLAAFRHWLEAGSGLPLDRPGALRVLPRGPESASVMLLSDLPAREDAQDGTPLGGEAWELAQRMIGAIGIAPEQAYVASLAYFHAPGARIARDELAACAEIARDHIRLARPQRLILLGDVPARALLGEPLAKARAHIHKVEGVRTIATFHPRWLLQRPSDKALAWRDLLLLMSEND
jgi:uracil-DNA glycosylase family 4